MPLSSYEQIMDALRAKRGGPLEAWIETSGHLNQHIFGVTYANGDRVPLGKIDPSAYISKDEYEAALKAAFISCGVDLSAIPVPKQNAEALRRARMQTLHELLMNSDLFGAYFPGSIHYQRHGFNDIPGTAYVDLRGDRAKAVFPNPERDKALETCRDLKRLRDGTTFKGERDNAQSAMDRLCAKHGIKEGEI